MIHLTEEEEQMEHKNSVSKKLTKINSHHNSSKTTVNAKQGLEYNIDELLKSTPRELPISILSLYLYARQKLLHIGYRGVYASAIAKARAYDGKLSGNVIANASKLEKASELKLQNKKPASNRSSVYYDEVDPIDCGDQWRVSVPEHVCIMNDYQAWVRVAIAVLD